MVWEDRTLPSEWIEAIQAKPSAFGLLYPSSDGLLSGYLVGYVGLDTHDGSISWLLPVDISSH
jgi:hypothetical protein